MKIAFYELEDGEEEYIKRNLKNQEILLFKERLNNKNLIKDCELISIRVHSIINKEILNQFEKIRYILTRTTGIDHIDIEECNKKNISIINIAGYATDTTAEHTFALILSLIKKIRESEKRTRTGNFSRADLKGIELKGKTIGIIGMGKIGTRVAEIAKVLGMNILANDIIKDEELSKRIGFEYVELEHLLGKSDIITIHCNFNESSEYLINNSNIKFVKKGSYLINTARGKIIETSALINALKEKILLGVCLDVMEEELSINERDINTLIKDNPLLKFDNVIITPHIGGNTKEASERRLEETINQMKKIVNKELSA